MPSQRPILVITSFGGFSIAARGDSGVGEPAVSDRKGHSKKLWMLLQYLIFSGKDFVSAEELAGLLWPEEGDTADPMAALRLLVHRARAELDGLGCFQGAELIQAQRGGYRWNRQAPAEIDTERFEACERTARSGNAPQRLEALLTAAELYRGRFLPKSTGYQWVLALDNYYHTKYIALCTQAAAMLRELGRAGESVALCRKAVGLAPFSEELQADYIEALIETGQSEAAMAQYKLVAEMLRREFNVAPSERLSQVYAVLARQANAFESNISAIRDRLSEPVSNGVFFCEFEIFRQFYQLKSRECRRTGQSVQLGLVTLTPAAGRRPGQRAGERAMDQLSQVIRESLRQGDICARFSALQYVALLQSTSYEHGCRALERVERNFRRAAARSVFLLQYNLLPVLPTGKENLFDEDGPDEAPRVDWHTAGQVRR